MIEDSSSEEDEEIRVSRIVFLNHFWFVLKYPINCQPIGSENL